MNFISAFKHAVIGYGISRAVWQPDAILSLNHLGEFYWLSVPKHSRKESSDPVKLLGDDKTFDLQAEDITATDWKVT